MADVLEFRAPQCQMKIKDARVIRNMMTIRIEDGSSIICVVPNGYNHVKSTPLRYYFIATAPDKPVIGFSRRTLKWEELHAHTGDIKNHELP